MRALGLIAGFIVVLGVETVFACGGYGPLLQSNAVKVTQTDDYFNDVSDLQVSLHANHPDDEENISGSYFVAVRYKSETFGIFDKQGGIFERWYKIEEQETNQETGASHYKGTYVMDPELGISEDLNKVNQIEIHEYFDDDGRQVWEADIVQIFEMCGGVGKFSLRAVF